MREQDDGEQTNGLTPGAKALLAAVLWTAAVAIVASYLLTASHRWDPVQLQFCGVSLLVWLAGLFVLRLLSRRGHSR